MAVYENKGYWYCDFQWSQPNGTKKRIREPLKDEKQRPCTSQTSGERAELRLREGLASGTLVLNTKGRVVAPQHAPADQLTFSGFKPRYWAEHVEKLKPSSISAQETIWRVSLLPTLEHVALREIDQAHFAKIAASLRKEGRSPKTINNALSALRTALSTANDWGLRGPPPKVKWDKVPEAPIEWFEEVDTEKLVAVSDPMVTVALKTGMRLGELISLKWSDVDLKANKVTVSRSTWWEDGTAHEGATKSGRIRTIPLPPSAIEALKAMPGTHKGDRYVFTNEHGGQLTKGETKWPLWRACEAAGLEKCGWHKLRHSYVSALVRKNVPLPTVQKLAGHARIEMTLRYTHASPADLARAVAVLS